MIKAHVREIIFASGLKIALQSNSILVILGPNNSGKSVTLSDIKTRLSGQNDATLSIADLSLHKESTLDQIISSIGPPQGDMYLPPGFSFHTSHVAAWWHPERRDVGPFLTQQLVSELTTRTRLSDCDPVSAVDLRVSFAGVHPFHKMYRDPALEDKISTAFRRAFKQDLIVHRYAGNMVPTYVGERPVLKPGETRESLSYSRQIEALPQLERQGDGIRSFVSILARVLTEDRAIQLIDEPEAFLHPPQARQIAESVGAYGGGRQTIVATHSSDILQGLLSDHATRVSVVRLTRHGETASASYLPSEKVTALWSDPILRFSKVLDGLFHDGVIVTEADADCRFYEAVANTIVVDTQRLDIHYTYSGGKDRLPIVIAALVGLKVPIATIVDFDVLNNDQPLRRILEAHGGHWSKVEADWKSVKASVEAKEAFVGGDQFRTEIGDLLKTITAGAAVPKAVLSSVKALAKRASPWEQIKASGLSAIGSGTPTVVANRLLENLRACGIFVAPQGEMEGFCRSIGGHGPRWVEEALKRNLVTDPELDGARRFAHDIITYLHDFQM